MTEPFNILVSSSGRRVTLLDTFREALDGLGLEGGVFGIDMSRSAPTFHTADRAFQVPRCTDPKFVPTVVEICREHDVRLLVPTIDPELSVYAQHRETFESEGVELGLSSSETIEICREKWSTHRWLVDNDLPTVRQTTVEEALEGDDWEFPLFAKPVAGSRSVGAQVVPSPEKLRLLAEGDEEYIVQTIAPGEEFTVSVFVDREGECRCAVPRKRLQVRAGEVSKGLAVRHEVVQPLAAEVAEKLPGAFGAMNVQVFYDRGSGEANVIEINPRFGGGYPLAWHAGARYSEWLIEEVLGRDSSARPDAWRDRRVMLRYDRAVYVDAEAAGVEE